jgi:hypothetical protein
MSKRLLALLFVGTISLAGVVLAQDPPAKDEPPVRLKKKKPRGDDKPMVDPDKPAEPKKDDKTGEKKKDEKKAEPREPEPVTPQEEATEVLHRVVSNVHKVDERLAKGDIGEATQQTQRDILKDLESLIQRSENPPPQGGGGQANQNKDQGGGDDQNNQNQQGGGEQNNQKLQGGGQNNQKQSSGQKSQGGGGGQDGGAGQRNQRTPGGGAKSGTKPGAGSQSGKQQRAEGKPKPGSVKPGGNQRAGMDGKNGEKPGGKDGKNGNGGGGGNKDDRARNKNADLDKDVWGHLPQTLRAQMDAYSNPQPFMPKYDDLIKRYYQTIAEQGRRKGE